MMQKPLQKLWNKFKKKNKIFYSKIITATIICPVLLSYILEAFIEKLPLITHDWMNKITSTTIFFIDFVLKNYKIEIEF
jgi:hypothetical protein